MPDYSYTAQDMKGKPVKGRKSALNAEEVANQLAAEGLLPIDIFVIGAQSVVSASPKKLSWFRSSKVSIDELHMFCRQMYALIHAGIPISTAVTRLAETVRNDLFAEALNNIVVSLNKGNSLHLSMSQYPNVFSDFFLNLIIVGENTGKLDDVFSHLADYLELEGDITKKIKTALRYPTMVISAIIIALLIINVFVLPAFEKLFAAYHGLLPLPTRILFATSNFIIHYWYLLIAILLGLFFGIRAYLRTHQGAFMWGKLQLKIPIIGWLIHRILLARFARLLSLVLRAGVSAVDGIQMVGASTGNVYVAEKIKSVTDLIVRGNSISAAIDKTQLFPPLVIQMIVLGEESGTIDHLLDEVGEFYQREINYDIVRISDSIEPIMLVVIGGMVLVLALGIFLPMWNLASLVRNH
jgi:MSHA biogenesis protein MshG